MLGQGPAYSTIAIVVVFLYIKASSYLVGVLGQSQPDAGGIRHDCAGIQHSKFRVDGQNRGFT
jgi:hypothetical protein